jgi:hypothetical protein
MARADAPITQNGAVKVSERPPAINKAAIIPTA